ncbi:trigger factor [Pseudofulvimonas gallinarii]|jgi:trigger factor|uniref:Trigger factor n=1 Tax=Pseudofulvimonas gallinarii TaxID=634155 RepID=A0A4R3LST8_9GAMM|nr:trigger factor [Pseudofulvimonas gallinarii]TCT01317.1 trigger factor [Pseudofulvimonas gallinarii]THD15075.1 trigger factor [Pseudofulvimonas gallinarii]
MQISLENTGTFERKLTVTLPSSRLDDVVRSRLQDLSREVRLKGFRPGKVPMSVIQKRYGNQVREEALGELIRDSFGEALRQENLRPAMSPRITPVGDIGGEQFAYTAEFEVLPELATIDVSGLSIERVQSNVEDADIDRMIETLRLQRRTWNPVERGAGNGDMVLFEHHAQAGDARFPVEGNERAGTILGSGAMLPAFETELAGLQVGDEKTFKVEFPADWRNNPELAGKTADVTVKVTKVHESRVPEVDADFIKSFGIADGSVEQFRSDVRANLQRELNSAIAGRLKQSVIDKLLAAYPDLEVPKGMVSMEAAALHADAQRTFAQAQQAGRQLPPVPAVEAFEETALRRVRAAVLIGAIAQQNDIRLEESRLREALATIASTYEDPEEVIQLYYSNQQLMGGLQQRVMEDQVAEWVAEKAKVEVREIPFTEVMNPQTA